VEKRLLEGWGKERIRERCIKVMLLASLVIISGGEAATRDASSCSQSDVQAAINSSSDGDTLLIPAGNCTWFSSVSTGGKAITIQGDGRSSTIITVSASGEGLNVTNNAGKAITIKSMKWMGQATVNGLIKISGTIKSFRITDCNFDWTGYGSPPDGAIVISGYAHGVIDHCTFAPANNSTYRSGIRVEPDGTANAYARDSALGTANSVYVEDCIFIEPTPIGYSHAIWAQNGGSYVFRHNSVTNWGIDMHGHCTSGGGREFEIYNNTFAATGSYSGATITIRGGTGVIYNNTFTSNGYRMYGQGLRMQEVDDGDICNAMTGGACHACTYPALYQLGRGKNNSLDPIYMWNNNLDGSYWVSNPSNPPYLKSPYQINTVWASDSADSACDSACGGAQQAPHYFTQLNRDYYDSESTAKPGYTSYTYPHPLVTGDAPPAAPQNLRLIPD